MARKTIDRNQSHESQISVSVTAVIHPEPDAGGYSAEVPSLPGCYTQGETITEVKTNLREAIEGWLAVAHDDAVGNTTAKRKRA